MNTKDTMPESEMADRILGRERPKEVVKQKIDWLAADVVWKISKPDCGTACYTGLQAAALMNDTEKKKAASGTKKITGSKGYFFERK
ncbi:MAG: hypothetical protein IJ689_05940 [Alphaproteobacteria bacterium]|nr:hypothetical protein [Alphaproteobacteria bacterium]